VRRRLAREVTRFGIAGIANLCLSFAIYQALLFVLPYAWAYTLSFVAGLAFVTVVNIRLVFGARMTVRNTAGTAAVYLMQYAAGLGLTVLLVQRLGVHARVAPFILVFVLPPLSFIGARLLVARDREARARS
jgi:putative flippase GtrA